MKVEHNFSPSPACTENPSQGDAHEIRKIAIYGKGGIGKSTTTSNIACAMTKQGLRVMQIGCDPKSDSTISHTGGQRIPTVLDSIRDRGDSLKLTDIVITGSDGVLCVVPAGESSRHSKSWMNSMRLKLSGRMWFFMTYLGMWSAEDSPCRSDPGMRRKFSW